MCDLDTENRKKPLKIDLLSSPRQTQKWVPQFLRRQKYWKVLSGNWKFERCNRIIYLSQLNAKPAENLSIIGPSNWNRLSFQVRFKILCDSIKPPEGGVILYFLFKNIKNYYSFHFCLFKQKIELIKRFRGIWTIMAEQYYDFETQKDYWITISTNSGIHQCQIDGTNHIEITDKDTSKGCVGIGGKYCDIEFSCLSVLMPSSSLSLV